MAENSKDERNFELKYVTDHFFFQNITFLYYICKLYSQNIHIYYNLRLCPVYRIP